MKKRGVDYVGPDGYFNNSVCPKEFMLHNAKYSQWGEEIAYSHLTIAEINGGIDGLLLGMNADDWEQRSELSLSQV